MRKGFLLAAAGIMALASCQEKGGYTISGTVSGASDGDYVYLQNLNGREMVTLDSAVVKGGKFEFKGMPDSVSAPKYITYNKNDQRMSVMLFVQEGNINVNMAQGNSKVSGTPDNDAFQKFMEGYMKMDEELGSIYNIYRTDSTLTKEQRDSLMNVMDKKQTEGMDAIFAQMESNITNPVGVYLLSSFGSSFDVEKIAPLFDKVPQKYASNEALVSLKEYVDNAMKIVVGKKYIDFSMNDVNGKTVKLSDFVSKNKYTLIDFWASWCGPCRQEMPNVVEAYKQYKDKGFGIVGVSLDNDEAKWKDAIKNLNMTWDHVSDLKGWQCEGAGLYGVRAIPATVLVDQEGTIIARNLRGEELAQKLAELMK